MYPQPQRCGDGVGTLVAQPLRAQHDYFTYQHWQQRSLKEFTAGTF